MQASHMICAGLPLVQKIIRQQPRCVLKEASTTTEVKDTTNIVQNQNKNFFCRPFEFLASNSTVSHESK